MHYVHAEAARNIKTATVQSKIHSRGHLIGGHGFYQYSLISIVGEESADLSLSQ